MRIRANSRARTLWALLAILLSTLPPALYAGGNEAPFQIPPSGKLEELVSGRGYQGPSHLTFDSCNRPYLLHSFANSKGDKRPDMAGKITTWRDGKWVQFSFRSAIADIAGEFAFDLLKHGIGSITIDSDDHLYCIAQTCSPSSRKKDKGYYLVYSPDLGKSFQAYRLPVKNWIGAHLETRTGHNLKKGAPAIAYIKGYGEKVSPFSRRNVLSICVPQKKNGRLILEPVEVTRLCFGLGAHSGGHSFAVTTGRLTHFVYAEYNPEIKGNPTYVATYDRESRKVVAKKHLFNATPRKVDVHSTPVITVDSKGHLHVVGGAHAGPFLYTRSLKPDTIQEGWTQPARMSFSQTYAALACDGRDVLHAMYRSYPGGGVVYQSKPAQGDTWSKRVPFVLKPKSQKRGYMCFYHQLVRDRADNLYACFTYFGTGNKSNMPRVLVASEDGGATWQQVRSEDIRRRLIEKPGP